MTSPTTYPQESRSTDEEAVHDLYRRMLDGWNQRSSEALASTFAEDGHLIGFDGSEMNGRAEIASVLQQIFTDHITPTYVAKLRSVRFLAPNVAILSAVAGLIPNGQSDINPQLNAVQTLVAVRRDGQWRIALFQNTPAQYHGRPELTRSLTEELRELL